MSSNIKFEIGAIARPPFLIKVLNVVLGLICFGITVYYSTAYISGRGIVSTLSEIFYMILVSYSYTFLTFWLLISSLFQADVMPKTVFEAIIGFLGFIMYLSASFSIFSLSKILKAASSLGDKNTYNAMIAAGVMGLLNGGLYLVIFILAFRAIRAG